MCRLLIYLWLLLSAVCLGQGIPAKDRIVILVSIDGFPAYMLQDPKLPVPNLRKLMADGAYAERLIPVNPTVTWPNHTSMVTGVEPAKHSVLYNGLLLRGADREIPRVEPWRDKAEMVLAPTIYDAAHKAGLTTAQVDWVAIQNPGTITWSFAERPGTADLIPREMVEAGLVSAADIAEFGKGNITWRDLVWTQAGSFLIEKHRPNLLLFHLLNTDSSHHRYGPRTLGGNSALALADARLGELLRSLEKAGLRDRATILVASDHGFKAVKNQIAPNVLLRSEGLLKFEGGRVSGDVWVIPEGGTAMVYVLNPTAKQSLLPKIRDLLGRMEGVDRVLGPQEFPSLGLPTPERNARMADLVLSAKDGYSFIGAHDGEPVRPLTEQTGSHGYLANDPEMHAIFVAWGYGIRRGARVNTVRTIDLAPTIAHLLDLALPNTDGQPVAAILSSDPRTKR
jgi:predicted AlkP superfamily pyrophosphatase or phosphodiesterase